MTRKQVLKKLKRSICRARLKAHGTRESSAEESKIKYVWIEEHEGDIDNRIQAFNEADRESKGE